jgi:hypothetical protein
LSLLNLDVLVVKTMLRSSRNLNARLREVQRSEGALMLGSWLSLVLAPFRSKGQTHAMKSFDFE